MRRSCSYLWLQSGQRYSYIGMVFGNRFSSILAGAGPWRGQLLAPRADSIRLREEHWVLTALLLAASFHGLEYGLKARVISQRCQTRVAPEVRDTLVAAGDRELEPFDRLGAITLHSIKIRRR